MKSGNMESLVIIVIAAAALAMPAAMAGEARALQRPTTAQLHAAMDKLDWMIGKWQGSGWIESATAGRREISYSVNVRAELGGLLLIVDGVGVGVGAGNDGWQVAPDSRVVYAEQLLISGPAPDVVLRPTGHAYTWQEFSRGAFLRGNDAQGVDRGIWVGLPFREDKDCDQIADESYREFCRSGRESLWSQTRIVRNEDGEWVQTREWQDNEPGRQLHTVFKVVLRQVSDAATGAMRPSE